MLGQNYMHWLCCFEQRYLTKLCGVTATCGICLIPLSHAAIHGCKPGYSTMFEGSGQAACMPVAITGPGAPSNAPTKGLCRQFEQMEVDGLLKKKRGRDCYQACSQYSCLQCKNLCWSA